MSNLGIVNTPDLPLVSVVMPVFNAEVFLNESINSILNQSYNNFEFIIIDDGSVDRSSEIINTFNDGRIVFIQNTENKGNYVCRNIGCKAAKGEYICIMDADDVAKKDRIEKQLSFFMNNPQIIACGSYFKTFDEQIQIRPCKYDILKIYLLYNNMFLHPSLMIKRDSLFEIGLYDEYFKYSADYNICCQLALRGEIINIPEPLMYYRVHHQQITSLKKQQQKEFADIIRLNYLRNNGFELSLEEEILFTQLMTHVKFIDTDSQNKIYLLFKKIISQNNYLKCFSQSDLERFLQIRIKDSIE